MKGIVFTEFFEMVELAHGYEMVDRLIMDNDLPSGGAYTTIGTYDSSEIITLLKDLSEKTGTSVPALLHAFGKHAFYTFIKGYPVFFKASKNTFDFLERIEKYIHEEVRKMYPKAELPNFATHRINENSLEMIYYADRNLGDFALGLIEKAFDHFQETATITREDFTNNGDRFKFLIERK